MVARGPFGIRTWSYDRRGTGGWERYLAEGYPSMCAAGQDSCPTQDAFDALNKLALAKGAIASGKIRDVWTEENAPDPATLAATLVTLQTNLAGPTVGNCPADGETNLAPPTYAACTPPAPPAGGTNTFGAAEWTTVVNEMLREAFFAEKVADHFADMKSMRQQLFISETPVLPAIKDDLQVAAADGNTATFNLQSFYAGTTGIAASIAGAAAAEDPALSAGLWVVSEVISMLPSASPTANTSFQTTYSGLEGKFAAVVQETDKALAVQTQQVLRDPGLMGLVGQLRSRGTWKLDAVGMQSAANMAFSLWAYQALLPTVFARYVITGCNRGPSWFCVPMPDSYAEIGGGTENFTGIATPPSDGYPCNQSGRYTTCAFNAVPNALAKIVWGPVTDSCNYRPNKPSTAWIFGSCSLGVDKSTSIAKGSTDWPFPDYHGIPWLVASASAKRSIALTGDSSTRRAASAARRAVAKGALRFTARINLPRGLRLSRSTVRLHRVLHDRGGRGELLHRRAGRKLPTLKLRRTGAGRFTYGARRNPLVGLRLRRGPGRSRLLDLSIRRLNVPRAPMACHALPASITPRTRPIALETRLRISDGSRSRDVRFGHAWRCRRDRTGTIARLVPVARKRLRLRAGLAATLDGPRVVRAGSSATYRIGVANRRTGKNRLRSSLWHVRVVGLRSPADARPVRRRWKIVELRRGRSRTFVLRVTVPAHAGGRHCTNVMVHATGARSATERICARVRPSTTGPAVTG